VNAVASGSYSLDALADSPYRVRGSLYLGTRSYFEANVAGGFGALLGALRPALREFMSQSFRTRAFYEVMDCPELIDVEARVSGLSVPRYLDRRTQWQASRDLSGARALLLRLAPPSFFVARMAAVMTDTFNFGRPVVSKVEQRCLRVEIAGVPQRLCAWLEHSVGVYGQACVEASGRQHVEVRSLPPVRVTTDGTVTLYVDMRWGQRR
jgi:hypothetical protein